ncbi:hypothetical protein HDU76_012461 [Blyttiomyces sp. JEL0837]|nr:hypothetical protein HDU76_012461 [Blyttiomyces sp. JEL0837]
MKDETTCIATPGFAGFVPSLKYQFGLTYGNATRHILQTDPSLKQGKIQQEHAVKRAHLVAKQKANNISQAMSGDQEYIWKRGNKYATGDDRFSFPPVPGYTGYIPRSQEHFGRPYVETTKASLADFESMLKSKSELPNRIQAIKEKGGKPAISDHRSSRSPGNAGASTANGGESGDAGANGTSGGNGGGGNGGPYKMAAKHPEKTFISGYTGFVPRLQNHFGEPYSSSVRRAIDEFTSPRPKHDPYSESTRPPVEVKQVNRTQPIPGFTGFIPGSKYGFATTFGKTTEIAYDNFNNRDERGRTANTPSSHLPAKQLANSLPIPGYRGHIPNYIFAAERSYGVSSKECIEVFQRQRETN